MKVIVGGIIEKEGKIYSTDELSRYTIKITINENDKDRLEIIH